MTRPCTARQTLGGQASRNMKVVYTSILNPWDPRHGGGQRAVDELARAMAGRDHEVDVVYSGIGGVLASDLPYRTHLLRHHERLYLNPLVFARFLRRLKLTEGVVHANGYEGAFLRYAVPRQVALVVTSHHPDPAPLLDIPGRLDWIGRARWIRRNIIPLMERCALRSADLVTSPSIFGAGSLRERGYLTQEARVEVVHYGTPPLPRVQACDAAVELVCVARLDHHKGIDILLRALSSLTKLKPKLDLVGTGPEERELRRIATELNLNDRVRFRGHLDRPSVAAILACAIALVLPSRSDNLPLAILEAMQAGLPIVATRVGGIPEEVRHEEEGLLVPPEDPVALAEALTRIICDSELRRRLGAAARARAATFTWERTAEQYENLYESLRGVDPE